MAQPTLAQLIASAQMGGVQDPALAGIMPRLNLAQSMLQEGTSGAPVQSPWQGVNRLAQALIGGFLQKDVEQSANDIVRQRSGVTNEAASAFRDPPATPPLGALGGIPRMPSTGGDSMPLSGAPISLAPGDNPPLSPAQISGLPMIPNARTGVLEPPVASPSRPGGMPPPVGGSPANSQSAMEQFKRDTANVPQSQFWAPRSGTSGIGAQPSPAGTGTQPDMVRQGWEIFDKASKMASDPRFMNNPDTQKLLQAQMARGKQMMELGQQAGTQAMTHQRWLAEQATAERNRQAGSTPGGFRPAAGGGVELIPGAPVPTEPRFDPNSNRNVIVPTAGPGAGVPTGYAPNQPAQVGGVEGERLRSLGAKILDNAASPQEIEEYRMAAGRWVTGAPNPVTGLPTPGQERTPMMDRVLAVINPPAAPTGQPPVQGDPNVRRTDITSPTGGKREVQVPVQPVPQPVLDGMLKDVGSLRSINDAFSEVIGRKGAGLGLLSSGALPEVAAQYFDPASVPMRALIAQINSAKIHDLTGAAQSVAEVARLRPFIPALTDRPEAVKDKLIGFQRELRNLISDRYRTFGPEAGGRAYPVIDEILAGGPLKKEGDGQQQPSATPPPGMPSGARQAPDGKFYVPDQNRPGKWLEVR
jgi:hypothetical protein